MNKLSHAHRSVSVPGKTILIGEHTVVYGYSALALPLSDIRLTLHILPDEHNSWNDAWKIRMQGKEIALSEHFKCLLTKSLDLALTLFGYNLSHFKPQTFFIDSQIPLGGGMGGSAAVSISLIKLCAQILAHPLSLEQEIEWANQIDSLFHSGRASGLDVTTILNNGLIKFKKGIPFKSVQHNCSFFLALVDSSERSATSAMIKKVAASLKRKNPIVQNALQNLGRLAEECEDHINQGDLKKFSQNLNTSQQYLIELGVSTPTVNTLCDALCKLGALCAKLTGAGGGGLVLTIFEKNPDFLFNIYSQERVFITHVT